MYLFKQILIKSIISLFVAIASVIGTKLATRIWDRCACGEDLEKEKEKTNICMAKV